MFSVQPTDTAAGASITPAVEVTIQDAFGNTVTSATDSVTISIGTNPSGGSLSGTLTAAAVAGVASFADLSIETAGSGYTLAAVSGVLTGAVSTAFDITAAAADSLVFTVQPSNATAGASITPAVQLSIRDQFGNTVITATSDVTISIGTNPAGGTLSGTATVAAVSGVATFSDLSIDKAGTGYTLGAVSGALTSPASSAFDITAGAASTLVFTGQPSNAVAGVAIAPAIAVSIQDAFGNTITGATDNVTIAIANNPGSSTLSGTATVAATAGVATFSDLSLDKAGAAYTLSASSGALTAATSSGFDITHAALSQFAVEASAGGPIGTQGQSTPFGIRVTALDAFSNTVTSFTGTVVISSTGTLASGGGTTAAFTAGVLNPHSVSISNSGTFTITATHSAGAETGTSNAFDVDAPPSVSATTPADGATSVLSSATISVTFDEPVTVSAASFEIRCPAADVARPFALDTTTGTTFILTPDAVLPGATLCQVTVVAANVADNDAFDPPDQMAADYVFSFSTAPAAVADTYAATGNIAIQIAANGVLSNDEGTNPQVSAVQGDGANVGVAVATAQSGSVTLAADGSFTYDPPAGFAGADTFTYAITADEGTSAPATVTINVSDMLWFVCNGCAGTDSGTLLNPYTSIASFSTNNTGAAGKPADNQKVYIRSGTYGGATDTLTLRSGQQVWGQGTAASTAITPAANSHPSFAALTASARPVIAPSAGNGIALPATGDNAIHHLDLGNTASANAAIFGNGTGTLTITNMAISGTGQVLNLTGKTLAASFGSIASTSSTTQGVMLSGVAGSLTATSTTISGPTSQGLLVSNSTATLGFGTTAVTAVTAGVSLQSNSGAVTFGSLAITTTGGTALLATDNSGTITVTSNTGAISATGGAAIDITKAAAPFGAVSLNFANTSSSGGTNAVRLQNLSGSANLGGGALTGTASGPAFLISGGSVSTTYSGGIAQGANALLVSIANHATGSVTFQTGTLNATSGGGVHLANADGVYSFSGTTTLGGGARVLIDGGSSGAINFASGATITNPTNPALQVSNGGSATSVAYAGTITTNAGRPVQIEGVSSGSVTLSGSITSTSNGILVQNNTGGAIAFSGGTKSLSTGANTAVTLSSNVGATISFTNGGLAISRTTGAGVSASGGGALAITGTGNTIGDTSVNAAGNGTALSVNGVSIGTGGLVFQSISQNGGANGIALTNTGTTAGLTVTGTGTGACGGLNVVSGSPVAPDTTQCTGGSILSTTGADGGVAGNGIYLSNTRSVSLTRMSVSGHPNHAIYGTEVTHFTLAHSHISGVNGSNVSVDEGSVSFDNLYGTAAITSCFIEGGAEDNIRVQNGFPVAASASLNRLTISDTRVGHNGANGNNGVLVAGYGTAVVNATVQNSRFTGARANLIAYTISENASGDVVISGNVGTNNHPNKLGSDFGFYVAHASNGAVTYQVSSNSVRDAGGSGIEVDRLSGGSGSMTGSITNNTVGATGVANSGSVAGSTIVVGIVGSGTTATHTTTITGNTLRQYTNYGLRLINRGTGNGYLNATVQSNDIREPSPNAAAFGSYSALRAELGASSAGPDDGRTCLHITGNTMNQDAGSLQATLRIFGRFSTRTALPGLVGDANAFLAGQNTITGTATPVNATSTNPFQSSCPPI
jgi:hypothetical protein